MENIIKAEVQIKINEEIKKFENKLMEQTQKQINPNKKNKLNQI